MDTDGKAEKKMSRINLRVPEELHRQIKARAILSRLSLYEYIGQILEKAMAEQEPLADQFKRFRKEAQPAPSNK